MSLTEAQVIAALESFHCMAGEMLAGVDEIIGCSIVDYLPTRAESVSGRTQILIVKDRAGRIGWMTWNPLSPMTLGTLQVNSWDRW